MPHQINQLLKLFYNSRVGGGNFFKFNIIFFFSENLLRRPEFKKKSLHTNKLFHKITHYQRFYNYFACLPIYLTCALNLKAGMFFVLPLIRGLV